MRIRHARLTTIDVTHIDHGGADLLRCSSLLGTDETSWAAAGYDTPEDKKSRAVFRSFNPLHGVVHDTDHPAHKYVRVWGSPTFSYEGNPCWSLTSFETRCNIKRISVFSHIGFSCKFTPSQTILFGPH